MNTYLHRTSTRLRVRSDYILEHPTEVKALIKQLEDIDAITEIKHQRHAGSVAISFDSKQIDCESLLETVESHGWLRSNERPDLVENTVRRGTKSLARGLGVVVAKQLFGPSIMRVLAAV